MTIHISAYTAEYNLNGKFRIEGVNIISGAETDSIIDRS